MRVQCILRPDALYKNSILTAQQQAVLLMPASAVEEDMWRTHREEVKREMGGVDYHIFL